MSRLDIEQWEKVTAEIEIRRWLAKIGLWAPGVDMSKWQTPQEAEEALEKQPEIEVVGSSDRVPAKEKVVG